MAVDGNDVFVYAFIARRLQPIRYGSHCKLALNAATLASRAVIENSDKTLQIFRFRILGFLIICLVKLY